MRTEFTAPPELTTEFDLERYTSAVARGNVLQSTQATVLDINNAFVTLRGSQDVLCASVDTEYAAATVDVLAAASHRADELAYTHPNDDRIGVLRTGIGALIIDSLGDRLMDYAEQYPGEDVTERIEALLFDSLSGLPPSHVQPTATQQRLTRFVRSRLTQNLQRIDAAAQERRALPPAVPTENDASYYTPEQRTVKHHANLVTIALQDATRQETAVKDALIDITASGSDHPYALEVLGQAFARIGAMQGVGTLLGLPGKVFAYRVTEGYGPSSHHTMTPGQYNQQTVLRMLSLERQVPGICRVLCRGNGFYNFGRHSEQMFLDIYADRHNRYDTWAYILFKSTDGNGSATHNSAPKLEQLRQQLGALGIGVKVAEWNTGEDLQKLAHIARICGIGPASIVVSDSHGFKYSLDGDLKKEDVKEWAGQLLADMTTADSTTFMSACSTGQHANGLAAELHLRSGRRTILASRGGSYLRHISARLDEHQRPVLDVTLGRKGKTRGRNQLRRFHRSTTPVLSVLRAAATARQRIGDATVNFLNYLDGF